VVFADAVAAGSESRLHLHFKPRWGKNFPATSPSAGQLKLHVLTGAEVRVAPFCSVFRGPIKASFLRLKILLLDDNQAVKGTGDAQHGVP